jgi:hypothetical protein
MIEVRKLIPCIPLSSKMLCRKQVEQNELKTDTKINLLHRSRLAGVTTTGRQVAIKEPEDMGGEEDVAMNLVHGCQTAPNSPVIDTFE